MPVSQKTFEQSNFPWLNDKSRQFLSRGYLPSEKTAEERVKDIANHAEKLLEKPGFAEKFYGYMSEGFYSLASPIWSNYGTDRGLPVSCFGTKFGDSINSILDGTSEVGTMAKFGGGCSGSWDDVRSRGSKISSNNGTTFGSVHFMELLEKTTSIISQGSVRRGWFSPYLNIDHDDAEEFIAIQSDNHPIQDLTHGVVVTDDFMDRMKRKEGYAATRWAQVINRRCNGGLPYVVFYDNVNNNAVDVYRDKQMWTIASNMCTEITLPQTLEESFVCVLSSMNAVEYPRWKNTDAVETLAYFLDSVVTEFLARLDQIKETEPGLYDKMKRAYRFARRHRALGMGVLGWHSFLQSKSLPFDSREAAKYNVELFKTVQERAWSASREMAEVYGEPEVLKEYGRRNTTLTAVAPTKSSSFILGQVSQGIEPYMTNYFVDDKAKTKVTEKNPFLIKLLEEKGRNDRQTWKQILKEDGSVQNLDFLSDHEKDVFRTFGEIDQEAIIDQAGIRQQWIDQSQSLNLKIGPSLSAKEINDLYKRAHAMGVKSLYYQYSASAAQEKARNRDQECRACEG